MAIVVAVDNTMATSMVNTSALIKLGSIEISLIIILHHDAFYYCNASCLK